MANLLTWSDVLSLYIEAKGLALLAIGQTCSWQNLGLASACGPVSNVSAGKQPGMMEGLAPVCFSDTTRNARLSAFFYGLFDDIMVGVSTLSLASTAVAWVRGEDVAPDETKPAYL